MRNANVKVVKKPQTETEFLRQRLDEMREHLQFSELDLRNAEKLLKEIADSRYHHHNCTIGEHSDVCSCHIGKIEKFLKRRKL